MSLVRCKDKRTGITYVYESESYWDKEKQQPRARRKLIGKIDEATGEIVPTDGRGRKRKKTAETDPSQAAETAADQAALLAQKDSQITRLTEENQKLREEKDSLLRELGGILERYSITEQ
ncbi:MAG: hypothetical protein LUC41_05805 [Clostridiales bacterium]|nr:hypothetical protein [Clostridiales bacterium]